MNDPKKTHLDAVYGPPPRRMERASERTNLQYGASPIPLHPGDGEQRREEGERQQQQKGEREEPLPLPKWLLVLYFAFPVILYVPDGLFNYFVYSDGVSIPQTDNLFLEISQIALWGFLSIGIVGMAYLLSMLAPWHWMHGHHIQAFFCGLGVVIATAVTIWNSLAFRSQAFHPFATDQWVYSMWPQLQSQHISLTMIFAAVAPPFWGLFWAIVQPTQTRRSLAHLQESHAERVMRLQQEGEIKALRAETNAKIREAQLKGMAQTAAAAREQAAAAFARKGADAKTSDKRPAGTRPGGLTSAGTPPRLAGTAQRGGRVDSIAKPVATPPPARASTLLGPDGRGSTDYIEPPSSGLPRSRVQRGS